MVSRASLDALAATVQRQHPALRQHIGSDGPVTLLFGDVEDCAQMTERLSDRAISNAIVHQHASIHNGYEVTLEGDHFLLAFANARQAVWCAIALQRALAARGATHPDRARRLRIGLHIGETIDAAVRLAAGIASQAVGGEILVSPALKQCIEDDDLGRSVHFAGAREVVLEGLTHPCVLHTVQWAERRGEVSPGGPA